MRPFDELSDLIFRARPRHSFAHNDQRPFSRFECTQGRFDRFRISKCPRWLRNCRSLSNVFFLALAVNYVVWKVQVNGPWTTEQRMPNRLVNVVRDPVDVLNCMRILAIRCREFDLTLLLKAAHAVLVHRRSSPDQNHRPAVLLCVR